MEALGVVASITGIVSLGIQLSQLLQQQLGEIRDAEERVNDLVSEMQATSNNLNQIKDLLPANVESSGKHNLNDRFRDDLSFLVDRLETIFRRVVKLLAKAGSLALSSVDRFLRPFKDHENLESTTTVKLDIELIQLSASNRALWSFRKPKVEQYIADLGRLKSELMLLLLVITLAKTNLQEKEVAIANTVPGTDETATLVDQIFYTDQTLNNPDLEHDWDTFEGDVESVDGSVSSSISSWTSLKSVKARMKMLYIDWPTLCKSDPPGIGDLLENKIWFEAYAINMTDPSHDYARLPISLFELYEKALHFAQAGGKTISDLFAELPFSQQKILEQTLCKISPDVKRDPGDEPFGPLGLATIVNFESYFRTIPKSKRERIKSLFGSGNSNSGDHCVRVTIMRCADYRNALDNDDDDDEEDDDDDDDEAQKGVAEKLAAGVDLAAGAVPEKAARPSFKGTNDEVKDEGVLAEPDAVPRAEEAKTTTATELDSEKTTATEKKKSLLHFKDAIGRKYSWPFEACCKWNDMEGLINHIFKHIEGLPEHIREGCYDLLDQNKNTILPKFWDVTVEPGWTITQTLWPLPEPQNPVGGPSGPSAVPPFPPRAADVETAPNENLNFDEIPMHKDPEPFLRATPRSRIQRDYVDKGKKRKMKKQHVVLGGWAPSDVERIADYKSNEANWKGTVDDQSDAQLRPSDADKMEVARYYLEKWTAGV